MGKRSDRWPDAVRDVVRSRRDGMPEHAVRTPPENAARALTQAEADARLRLGAIRIAEEKARSELQERQKA